MGYAKIIFNGKTDLIRLNPFFFPCTKELMLWQCPSPAIFRSRRTDKSGGLTRQHNLDKAPVSNRNDSDRRAGSCACPLRGACPGSARTCHRPYRATTGGLPLRQFPSHMAGAAPCACPLRDATCPGSADMPPPGLDLNHYGSACYLERNKLSLFSTISKLFFYFYRNLSKSEILVPILRFGNAAASQAQFAKTIWNANTKYQSTVTAAEQKITPDCSPTTYKSVGDAQGFLVPCATRLLFYPRVHS